LLPVLDQRRSHTDLDAGYTSQDRPSSFTALELSEPQATGSRATSDLVG
jgi:hypothetical protein